MSSADFDGDGDADLLLYSQVMLNQGAGVYTEGPGLRPPDSHADLRHALGDLDGNGTVDLAYVSHDPCSDSAEMSILLNAGDASFTHAGQFAIGEEELFQVLIADLNGDSKQDLLLLDDSLDDYSSSMWVFLNTSE